MTKKRAPFVESSAQPVELSRSHLPELLKTLEEDGHAPGVTWNAVDALELLVEAGHFRAARALADGVHALVAGSPRERLFRGYVALCELMQNGSVRSCAQAIEALHLQISAGGHSAADRARAALIVARALFVGVSLGVLPDEDLLRARMALAAEFDSCCGPEAKKHRVQLGLELAKTYLHAPKPEALQAKLLVDVLSIELAGGGWSDDVALEVERLRFQVDCALGAVESFAARAEQLRNEARSHGELQQALVELSIARCAEDSSRAERLQAVLPVFEAYRCNSGLVEALFIMADAALSRGLGTRASALFARVEEVALESGHLQAILLSIHGTFQAALADGDIARAQEISKALEGSLGSELAVGAIGFSAAQAAQILSDSKAAVRCAKICEEVFRAAGVRALQAQALHLSASALAASGDWVSARKAWKESLTIEEQRRAVVSASEKRAALAQAGVMSEFSTKGFASDRALREAERLLVRCEQELEPYESLPAAQRSRAKCLSIRAQLGVLSKDPVSAVSHLHKARAVYQALGSARDVALTDALSGLAMLEVGKSRGGELYEEAHGMLQRALEFFDAPRHNAIRWKLKYYLSMSAYLSSQARGHGQAGLSWRETSAAWLRGAMVDLEKASEDDSSALEAADFSPGLSPKVLEPLQRALGLRGKTKPKPSAADLELDKLPGSGGYLH